MGFLSTVTSAITGTSQIVNTYNNIRDDYNTLTDVFDGGGVGTFSKSGLSVEEYKRELREAKINLEKLQHMDVFKVEIVRVEPYYDTKKSEVITSMMKSVSIVHDGVETQEDRVGSGYINWHKGRQSGEVQVVFYEFQDGSVVDFLTKVSPLNSLEGSLDDLGIGASIRGLSSTIDTVTNIANKYGASIPNIGATLGGLFGSSGSGGVGSNKNGNIIPSDGTTLLPYEYYFKIRVSNMRSDLITNTVYETIVLEDDFILDGNLSEEYATGDEQYLEVSATLKPIKSWR